MATLEILGLVEGTPQIAAPQAGDTYVGPIVLQAATGNEIAYNLQYTTNKAAGNDTGLLINLTDTASPGVSLLQEWQVGNVNKASLDSVGSLKVNEMSVDNNTSFKLARSTNHIEVRGFYGVLFTHINDVVSGDAFRFESGVGDQLTASSGIQSYISAAPEINQSGTAGYTGIFLDVIETATGSGANNLLDLQADSISKVLIDNTGTYEADKTTADEGFFNFVATEDADATSALSSLATSGATTGHIQVAINGTKAWIAVSTTNPS